MEKNKNKEIYIIGWILLLCAGVAAYFHEAIKAFLDSFMLPCLFHEMTGYYCPGCGGTRAALYLISGHWLKSFFCHPIVLYVAVLYLWYMISYTIEFISKEKYPIGMRYRNLYLWIALILVILNCIIKNGVLWLWGIPLLS